MIKKMEPKEHESSDFVRVTFKVLSYQTRVLICCF